MNKEINELNLFLNKVSFSQLLVITSCGIFFLLIHKINISAGLLISSVATFLYTQLIRLSSLNKIFALYGFPVRLLLIAPPVAILVHKLNSNLLALFCGFVLGQLIYLVLARQYFKNQR